MNGRDWPKRTSSLPHEGTNSRGRVCVLIGAMRCHSQGLTIKLRRDVPLAEIETMLASAHE